MPDNNTVERAEQRKREMDRVTREFSEQGNRYMQQMNARHNQNMRNVRDAVPVPERENSVHNNVPRSSKGGTRFEPVERKRNVPRTENAAESPPKKENAVPPSRVQRTAGRNPQNTGIDGEKILLMALMYLLIAENADIKLILAIGYLIL